MTMHAPFSSHVAACAHGVNLAKAWVFWSNYPDIQELASICPHVFVYHPPFAGKRCLMDARVGLGDLFGRQVWQVAPLIDESTTRRGGRSGLMTTPSFLTAETR